MQIIPQGSYAQKLFDNEAGLGTDKAVSKAVMLTVNELLPMATNEPSGNENEAIKSDHKADTIAVIADIQKLYSSQVASSISITLVGETHGNQNDTERANSLIDNMNNGNLTPTMVVFERGMAYPTPSITGQIAREGNLTTVKQGEQIVDFGLGLSVSQRSMVVAGYLVLCLAGGDQNNIDKVILFYGENHGDILQYFEYFAAHTKADYLKKRGRTLLNIWSYTK